MNLVGYKFSLSETAGIVGVPATTLTNWITSGVPGIERAGRGRQREFDANQVTNLAIYRDLLPIFGRDIAIQAIGALWPWAEKHVSGPGNLWLIGTPVKSGASWFQFDYLADGEYPQPQIPTNLFVAFNLTPGLWPELANRIVAAVKAKTPESSEGASLILSKLAMASGRGGNVRT